MDEGDSVGVGSSVEEKSVDVDSPYVKVEVDSSTVEYSVELASSLEVNTVDDGPSVIVES